MTPKRNFKPLLFITFLLAGSPARAVPIGIVDSGTDLKHPDLISKAWINPGNLEGDPFREDTHGWNFAGNDNQIIDYSYLGKFSPDPTQFFKVQLKIMMGTASIEEQEWMTEKRENPQFIHELQAFGNFVHGTHVAGISAQGADQAKIMAAKIIPTEVKNSPSWGLDLLRTSFTLGSITSNGNDQNSVANALYVALGVLAERHAKNLEPVGKYLKTTGMVVANCSFGTSHKQAQGIVQRLAKRLTDETLSPSETDKLTAFFMNQILEKGASFVTSAQHTLFVMAAGNEGSNNDELPTFPANLKLENTLTVAATRNYDRLASFSSYGAQSVDIAAPGVGIVSDIPGGETLPLSGTSQAAPFITNLAGRMMDLNPHLGLQEIKQLLMQTVDKKKFLIGKVLSEGIANKDRAILAAKLSRDMSLTDAIARSRQDVKDVPTLLSTESETAAYDGEPFSLPSTFLNTN